VAMIAMCMRDDNAREPANLRGQELLAQVRTAIDQQPLTGAFDEDRRP